VRRFRRRSAAQAQIETERRHLIALMSVKDTVEDTTVAYPRNATRLVGQHRLYGNPFKIGEFITRDVSPAVWEF
jgi:hypothetical protein